jgi:hypothetical protein
MSIKPLAVSFTPEEIEAITKLATSQGITATSVLRKAIADESYIQEKQDEGAKFFIRYPNGEVSEVSF